MVSLASSRERHHGLGNPPDPAQKEGCLVAGVLQLPLAVVLTSFSIAAYGAIGWGAEFWEGVQLLTLFAPFFVFTSPWLLLYAMGYSWLTMLLAQRLFPLVRAGEDASLSGGSS